jgi:hypothetical protein
MSEETVQKPTFDQAAESAMKTIAEQKTVEPAKDDTKAEPPKTEEQPQAETPPEESAETEELLTKEEVATLDEAGKTNYAKMQKAFTTKTQKLAADRKEVERLAQYKELIDDFEKDPAQVIKRLAPEYGLTLAEAAKQEPVKETVSAEAAQGMQNRLRALLGEGNEALADGLADVFKSELNNALNQNLQPIKEQQQAALMEAAKSSTEADLKAFEQKHPDFKTHEKAMLDISKKWSPAPNATMEVDEYLETLYRMATLSASETVQTKKVIERINKAAAASEPQESAVNSKQVTPAKPKRPTIEEAFEAAKRGVAW